MNHRIIPILVVSAVAARADILSSTQRFLGLGGQSPEYSEETRTSDLGQAPYSPADSDFGVQDILVERGSREPVVINTSNTILRTDTAPSSTGNDRSSWLYATTFAVSWRPFLGKGWFADLGLSEDILRYDRTDGLDFENFGTRVGIFRIFPELDDTIVYGRFEYQRITAHSLFNSDYNAQRIRAGLQKIVWSAPRQQVFADVSGAYEWSAHPTNLERNEFSVQVSHSYGFTDSLHSVVSAKASRFNFEQFGRDDWTYGLSAQLIWQISERFSANASLAFDKNDSDSFGNFNEYESWSAGVGVGMQYSF